MQPGAMIIGTDTFFANKREQLVALTARETVPAIYDERYFVEVGRLHQL